jgi:hypothetical protein
VHNIIGNWLILFYRRLKFYIKQYTTGTYVPGVAISIIDGSANRYSGVTDSNGYVYIDVLEQKTEWTVNRVIPSYHEPFYDTFYSNFIITITKLGFDTEHIHIERMFVSGTYDIIFNLDLHSDTIIDPEIVSLDITDCSLPSSEDGSIEVTASGNEILAYSIEKL